MIRCAGMRFFERYTALTEGILECAAAHDDTLAGGRPLLDVDFDRYRKARTPVVEREGPYPTPPNGRKAYSYLITEFGERWVTWARL